MWGFIIAILSGALMSVQGVLNTGVTKETGIWVSASFVQFTALIVCLIAWLVTGRQGSFGALFAIEHKYMLLGGAIGAFITFTVVRSVGTLGPAKANLLIVIAQIVIAYVIELFGWFSVDKVDFEWRKIIGMAVAVVGFIIFNWDHK